MPVPICWNDGAIPSGIFKGNDSDFYKEFLSESNKDMVWLDYKEKKKLGILFQILMNQKPR